MPMRMQPEDVTRLRVALARIVRTIDRQVDGGGLTRTELSVLGTVSRLKAVTAGELADIEGLNPTMLSRIVGKLESAGIVTRTPDPDDRRVVRIGITPEGSRLHNRMRRERSALISARLDEIPEQDARAVLAALPALESLAEAMRSVPVSGVRR